LGTDPELSKKKQLLNDIRWVPRDQLNDIPVVPEQLASLVQGYSSLRFNSQ
jgi:hypothetical protein